MNHLPTLPLLEALRPPSGWRTDRAILSAYSAEPRVLVSLLLALAGRDDDSGSGSRVALARTLCELSPSLPSGAAIEREFGPISPIFARNRLMCRR